MTQAYIRTPIGRFGVSLSPVRTDHVATMCIGVGQGIAIAVERA